MNVTALSREDLVSEMLAPLPPTFAAGALRVSDADLSAPPSPESLLARRLSVARELLLRDLREQMHRGPVMTSPQILRDWLRLYCAGLEHEVFLVLYLDANHRLIEPQELLQGALARNAAALAVAHTHPSGQADPSRADEFLTQTLKSTLSLVDVRIIDHFVVAGDQVVSFAERGLI